MADAIIDGIGSGYFLKVNNNNSINVRLFDGVGSPINSLKNALNTHDADVHTRIIFQVLHL